MQFSNVRLPSLSFCIVQDSSKFQASFKKEKPRSMGDEGSFKKKTLKLDVKQQIIKLLTMQLSKEFTVGTNSKCAQELSKTTLFTPSTQCCQA